MRTIFILAALSGLSILFFVTRACLRRRPQLPDHSTTPGFPNVGVKPRPVNTPFRGCPPEGDGGDRALNLLKNRSDEGDYLPVGFEVVERLPWPQGVEQRHRDRWTSADVEAVTRYEGTPIAVEGYLAGVREEGPESCNCYGADGELRDLHLWLTRGPNENRSDSLVVEITPRGRANHPRWREELFNRIVEQGGPVRISGWLMLDPDHPEQLGRTRGSIWEVHPVMKVEVAHAGEWVSVDDLP